MKLTDQVLEFSPQELGLLGQILTAEVRVHPETAALVQPLLDKVIAHFAAAWPYDYQIYQEEAAFLEGLMHSARMMRKHD